MIFKENFLKIRTFFKEFYLKLSWSTTTIIITTIIIKGDKLMNLMALLTNSSLGCGCIVLYSLIHFLLQ